MAAYLDDKTKKWFCTFKYKDWTGKTRKTTKRGFAKKKDALAYEMYFKNQSQNQPDVTIDLLAEKYLDDYKINHKLVSYISVKNKINKYILPVLSGTMIDNITPYTIKQWQNDLSSKGLKESTIRAINVCFSMLLNYAVKYFNLNSNPFTKTGKTGKTCKRIDFWELEEFKKAACYFCDNEYDNLVFNLLFWSGMRIGELQGLTVEDIDFNTNTINIKRTFTYTTQSITTPKTPSSIRTITMPATVMNLAKEYFKKLYVIPQFPFTAHAPLVLINHLRKYAKQAGIKELTLHGLRHSHASYLIQKGVAITAISRRLGHSNPAITLSTYSHCYKDSDTEIAQILEKGLQKGFTKSHSDS